MYNGPAARQTTDIEIDWDQTSSNEIDYLVRAAIIIMIIIIAHRVQTSLNSIFLEVVYSLPAAG